MHEPNVSVTGYRLQLNIIYQGSVIHYLNDDDFENSLPSVPSEVDTVNLTWEAGDELVSQKYRLVVQN